MKLSHLAAAAILLASPSFATEQENAGKPGYKATGLPITNPAEPGYNPDLVVCRMEDRIGSRAKRRKVCLANRVWQRVAREQNAFARKMVADLQSGMWGG